MPSIQWNKLVWDEDYNWDEKGEEWSECWGNSYGQFYSELFPRLANLLPSRTVLEIAPGYGRWTQYLLKYTNEKYIGVDIAEACIQHCRKRFAAAGMAEFYQNDGKSLEMVEDNSITLAFSFDSLVHADMGVIEEYIRSLLKKIKVEGFAFIHHSNLCDAPEEVRQKEFTHYRDETVTAAKVRHAVKSLGGHICIQEILDWGGCEAIDAITVFRRNEHSDTGENVMFHNNMHLKHSQYSKEVISRYSGIGNRAF